MQNWEVSSTVVESRGVVQALDPVLGVGVLISTHYLQPCLAFFLEDIELDNGWQRGLAVGDCVEFDTCPQTKEELDLVLKSRECRPFLKKSGAKPVYPLSDSTIAINLRKIAKNSVTLDEPLWGHPRYLGFVDVALEGTDVIDSSEQMYREDTVNRATGGMIQVIRAHPHSLVPSISHVYSRQTTTSSPSSASHTSDFEDCPPVDASELLDEGYCMNFEGSDLLSLRVILEEGDVVEFDAYRNNRTGKICATNIMFVDPRDFRESAALRGREARSRGKVERVHECRGHLTGTIRVWASEQRVEFDAREWLDRDELPREGTEVEFEMRYVPRAAAGGRRRGGGGEEKPWPVAARITQLPKGFLSRRRCVYSDEWVQGTVRVNDASEEKCGHGHDDHGHDGHGHGRGVQQQQHQYIELDDMSKMIELDQASSHLLLVAGDTVLFKMKSEVNSAGVESKMATNVVVSKQAPRRNTGRIYSLHMGRSRYRHGVDQRPDITHGFIQIGPKKTDTIYFRHDAWIHASIPLWYGMAVEFNILVTKGDPVAVRVRPSEWPQDEKLARTEPMRGSRPPIPCMRGPPPGMAPPMRRPPRRGTPESGSPRSSGSFEPRMRYPPVDDGYDRGFGAERRGPPHSSRRRGGGGPFRFRLPEVRGLYDRRNTEAFYFVAGVVVDCQWKKARHMEEKPKLSGVVEYTPRFAALDSDTSHRTADDSSDSSERAPEGESSEAQTRRSGGARHRRRVLFSVELVVPWQMRVEFKKKDLVVLQLTRGGDRLLSVELLDPCHFARLRGVGIMYKSRIAMDCRVLRELQRIDRPVAFDFTQILFEGIKRDRETRDKCLVGGRFVFDLSDTAETRDGVSGTLVAKRVNAMDTLQTDVLGTVQKMASLEFATLAHVGKVPRYVPNGVIHARFALGRDNPRFNFSLSEVQSESHLREGSTVLFDIERPIRCDQLSASLIRPTLFNIRHTSADGKQLAKGIVEESGLPPRAMKEKKQEMRHKKRVLPKTKAQQRRGGRRQPKTGALPERKWVSKKAK